eukprot:PhF_6_TR37199/c0_g1_i1/m.54816
MRVQIKWFLTGNVDVFEDRDDIIGPQTTILELKGLVQIRYGFPAKEVGFIYKHLLDNHETLRSIGIVDQASADKITLTVHVFRDEDEGEESNVDPSKEPIAEFTHDDYILAMKMLGKEVPVDPNRLQAVKQNAPRARPQFLNDQQTVKATSTSAASSASHHHGGAAPSPLVLKLHDIYNKFWYGQRVEGVEQKLALTVASHPEPFEYWDTRLPENPKGLPEPAATEVILEVFFFGPYDKVDPLDFGKRVVHKIQEVYGIQSSCVGKAREAGCMYPLIAVPIKMTDKDGWKFSELVFEKFGEPVVPGTKPPPGTGVKGGTPGCAQQ